MADEEKQRQYLKEFTGGLQRATRNLRWAELKEHEPIAIVDVGDGRSPFPEDRDRGAVGLAPSATGARAGPSSSRPVLSGRRGRGRKWHLPVHPALVEPVGGIREPLPDLLGRWATWVGAEDPVEPAVLAVVLGGVPLADVRAAGELLLDDRRADPAYVFARLRSGVVDRLLRARSVLPGGLRLLVVERFRPPALQQRCFEKYAPSCARPRPTGPRRS
ncbi:hypothetical protein [Streptomyces sp. NPDC089799]|uniref:hypothetical protein n=1 Tax=Streptomyces sp. NPDC089799 TaxID=3155066 RepID=UPI0034230560